MDEKLKEKIHTKKNLHIHITKQTKTLHKNNHTVLHTKKIIQ